MTLLDQLTEAADDLTEPHMHSEPVRTWDKSRNMKVRHYRLVLPGLLAQVHQSVIPTVSSREAYAASTPGSRPPLAIEALSRHDEISMAVLAWCRELGLATRVSAESNIRALVGAAPALDTDDLRELVWQMRRWRGWCAVLTGWENLYQPTGVPCPVVGCEQVSTLRINLTAKTGMCQTCGSTWTEQGDGSLYPLGPSHTCSWLPASSDQRGDHAAASL
ncbi:MAG: hypothetical protein ABW046_20490 [Actinoplanes sp.]